MSVRRLAPAERQPASFAFSPELSAFADRQVTKFPEGRQASAVIPLLWEAQKQEGGWLPQKAMEAVAERLGMPLIRVMEVATFYTMFNLEPAGRYFVQLCGTVPCHVKGAIDLKQVLLDRIGDPQHVTADGLFSWLEVECLGACCNAPMVQINDDYFEDLTPELLATLLDDLAAGKPVKVGPQNGRHASEPQDAVNTLTDPGLYDGSVVGSWRKRFESTSPAETGETQAATATGPNDPKPGTPDAGRAEHKASADAPAQQAAKGERASPAEDRRAEGDPSKATVSDPKAKTVASPPTSDKSYTMTPSRPEEGRVAADAKGTSPVSGAPSADGPKGRDEAGAKPVGADPDASPGVAPKE